MTGVEDHNTPLFNMVAQALREKGYEVVSPSELYKEDPGSLPWETYLRGCIAAMMKCRSILLLPDWVGSRGARKEVEASIGLGFKYYELRSVTGRMNDIFEIDIGKIESATVGHEEIDQEGESIFEEADRLVHGARHDDYGHPFHDFGRAGLIWHAVLRDHYDKSPEEPIPPELVSLCMVGLKISREINRPKRDNRVDGAGYFGTLQIVSEYRDQQKSG